MALWRNETEIAAIATSDRAAVYAPMPSLAWREDEKLSQSQLKHTATKSIIWREQKDEEKQQRNERIWYAWAARTSGQTKWLHKSALCLRQQQHRHDLHLNIDEKQTFCTEFPKNKKRETCTKSNRLIIIMNEKKRVCIVIVIVATIIYSIFNVFRLFICVVCVRMCGIKIAMTYIHR